MAEKLNRSSITFRNTAENSWKTAQILSSYPDASITLQQGKSGLIRPYNLFQLLHSPIFTLPRKLKPLFPPSASLISGFLKATQLLSPSPLSSLRMEAKNATELL